MRTLARLLAIALLLLVLAACTPYVTLTPTALPAAVIPLSKTPVPFTPTIPLPTETPLPPTITPTHALETAQAKVSVEAMNLRQGPGTTFAVIGRLTNGTQMTVLAKALGDQWAYVDTGKQKGWLSIDFLSISGQQIVDWLPWMIEIDKAMVIHGQVLDQSGQGIAMIGFALTQGDSAAEKRVDAVSLPNGNFYFYLPTSTKGTWNFSLVSYDCRSRVMDSNCKITGTFSPTTLQFDVLKAPDIVVKFSE